MFITKKCKKCKKRVWWFNDYGEIKLGFKDKKDKKFIICFGCSIKVLESEES